VTAGFVMPEHRGGRSPKAPTPKAGAWGRGTSRRG
jgi:hypothetical protein